MDAKAPSSAPEGASANAVERLSSLLADELAAVDALIHRHMASPVALIPNLASYLIDAGGKRVRPMVTLAATRLFGESGLENARRLAAAVEFIHTATLLHDDVVDESDLRRGKKAANLVWGNSASVLVGDFLFARSFNLMVETDDLAMLAVLSRAAAIIAEGEVMQLSAMAAAELPLPRYLAIIDAKTAALFAAAARVGAMAAGQPPGVCDQLEAFGRNLGLAFQLADDALDYGGRAAAMGKNSGDDFREGKITLPVICAMAKADADEAQFWRRTFADGDRRDGDLERAIEILAARGAIVETLQTAAAYAEAAKANLAAAPDGPLAAALCDLADFVVTRAY